MRRLFTGESDNMHYINANKRLSDRGKKNTNDISLWSTAEMIDFCMQTPEAGKHFSTFGSVGFLVNSLK